jgi:hypothetical protein
MNIVVNEALKAYIDPLTPEEYEALERSILAEGCRDALVLWGDLLVDGHNRYGICQKHGLPFQTVQSKLFHSMEDVHLWMIDQHLGRRSVSDFQRGVLALRKREIVAERRARWLAASSEAGAASAAAEGDEPNPPWDTAAQSAAPPAQPLPAPLKSREDVARAARTGGCRQVGGGVHQHRCCGGNTARRRAGGGCGRGHRRHQAGRQTRARSQTQAAGCSCSRRRSRVRCCQPVAGGAATDCVTASRK